VVGVESTPVTAEGEARKPTALVLLDHGSRRAEANNELVDLAGRLAALVGGRYLCVEPAHMELAAPSLAQAFGRCVAEGAEQIVIVVFFLATGAHSTGDIPRLAAEASASHGNVDYLLTAPLGTEAGIVELLASLADKTLSADS